jgi:hypothetical protein
MLKDVEAAKGDAEHMAGISGECGSAGLWDYQIAEGDEQGRIIPNVENPEVQWILNRSDSRRWSPNAESLQTLLK